MNLLTKLYVREVSAAYGNSGSGLTKLREPGIGIENMAQAFALAMNVALGVGISLTVIFLIMGGIQYITSKGDQKAAQEARNSLTNAIIGFVVVIGAFAIKSIVMNLLGADVEGLELIIPE